MTNLLKKALSVCMAATMLVTASCITVLADDTQDIAPAADEVKNEAKVKFTIGEPDESGIFTAKLSLHNMQFLALQFGITFNNSVINAVDKEGNPTEDFEKAVICYPVDINGMMLNFEQLENSVSNEKGVIRVASYIMIKDAESKVVSVDEEGFVAYEFQFKKVADGDFGFGLADIESTLYEKEAIISDGSVFDFTFEFIYPESNSSENTSKPIKNNTNKDEQPSEPTKEEQKKARLKDTAVLQIDNYAVSVEGVIKWVDKDNKNVVPYIENDRTMVPLRFISETFGADVEWIPGTRTIEIVLEDTKITMQLDNRDYQINGETKAMDTAPIIREDRTFVPIRFVSEALEKAVYWNGNTGVVVVAPLDNPWDDTDSLSQELMTQTLLALKWLGDEAYSHLKN
ncbi:MAG TPA: hypothetical protein DD391_03275 [Clostridiales bacterium]|jgi:hypothetical protein|nr:copper amine oxidase N-terminal domain-containing protein [Clostridiales bacterium]HBL81609.1 hypothetical protein [Clostridiales bacterium]